MEREQRTLYWQKAVAQEMVSNSVLERAEFDVISDLVLPALTAQLTTYVLTDHVLSRTQWATHDVPASWWQMLKRDVLSNHTFTRWVVNKWPVRYDHYTQPVTFNEDRNYVDSRVLPERQFGRPVIVETINFGEWHHEQSG